MPDAQEKQPKTYQKTKDAIAMVQAGISPENALKYANLKDKVSAKQVSVLRGKVRKHTLTSPKAVKLAHDCVIDTLQGKGVPEYDSEGNQIGERCIPTATNRNDITRLIYDRYEPAIKVQANINMDIDPVDLSAYLNSSPMPGLELSPQVVDITNDNDSAESEIHPKIPPKE